MSVSDRFAQYIQRKDEAEQRPIFTQDGFTFAFIKHNNLFLTCATKHNSNIALLLMYLYRLVMVFKDYFGELEEESIRDNFVVIYELMDETMDFGYPQAMDSKILREYALCHEKNAQLLIILSQVYYSRKQPTRECTKATRRCYKCRFMA